MRTFCFSMGLSGLVLGEIFIAAWEPVMYEVCRAAALGVVELRYFWLTFLVQEVEKEICFEHIGSCCSVGSSSKHFGGDFQAWREEGLLSRFLGMGLCGPKSLFCRAKWVSQWQSVREPAKNNYGKKRWRACRSRKEKGKDSLWWKSKIWLPRMWDELLALMWRGNEVNDTQIGFHQKHGATLPGRRCKSALDSLCLTNQQKRRRVYLAKEVWATSVVSQLIERKERKAKMVNDPAIGLNTV